MAKPLLVTGGRTKIRWACGKNVGLAPEATDALSSTHERDVGLHFDALELMVGGPVFKEASQLLIHGLFHARQIARLARGSSDNELAANFALIYVGRDLSSDLFVIDEPLIKAGTLAGRENSTGKAQITSGGWAVTGDVPDFVNTGVRNTILNRFAVVAGHFRNPGALMSNWRARRNFGEVSGDFFLCLMESNIASDDENGVRRRVIGFEPVTNIFERGGIEVFHGPDDGVRVRVAGRVSGFDN